jgi:hypothetical protein
VFVRLLFTKLLNMSKEINIRKWTDQFSLGGLYLPSFWIKLIGKIKIEIHERNRNTRSLWGFEKLSGIFFLKVRFSGINAIEMCMLKWLTIKILWKIHNKRTNMNATAIIKLSLSFFLYLCHSESLYVTLAMVYRWRYIFLKYIK